MQTASQLSDDLAEKLKWFVDYYEQCGIGDCEEGKDNEDDGGEFDGDERFNVRHGRQALERYAAALTALSEPSGDGDAEAKFLCDLAHVGDLNPEDADRLRDIAELLYHLSAMAPFTRDEYIDMRKRAEQGVGVMLKIGEEERQQLKAERDELERRNHMMMEADLTPFEYDRLVAWINDPNRQPANTAFTAGATRTACYAIENSGILDRLSDCDRRVKVLEGENEPHAAESQEGEGFAMTPEAEATIRDLQARVAELEGAVEALLAADTYASELAARDRLRAALAEKKQNKKETRRSDS